MTRTSCRRAGCDGEGRKESFRSGGRRDTGKAVGMAEVCGGVCLALNTARASSLPDFSPRPPLSLPSVLPSAPLSPDTYSLTCLPPSSASPAFPLPSSESLPWPFSPLRPAESAAVLAQTFVAHSPPLTPWRPRAAPSFPPSKTSSCFLRLSLSLPSSTPCHSSVTHCGGLSGS